MRKSCLPIIPIRPTALSIAIALCSNNVLAVTSNCTISGTLSTVQTCGVPDSGNTAIINVDGAHITSSGNGISSSSEEIEITFSGTNTIIVDSNGDTGVLAKPSDNINGKVTMVVESDSVLNITNVSTTRTDERDGLEAISSGTGSVYIQHSGSGTIETINGHAINAKSRDDSSGKVILDGDTPAVLKTTGDKNYGINLTTAGAGSATIQSNATIETTGDTAHGIRGYTVSGKLDVTNTGSITTAGINASGIQADSQLGHVTVTNGGSIKTSGINARGIRASTQSGNVIITNESDIETTGHDSVSIHGISNNGSVTITDITANTLTSGSKGIVAEGAGVDVTSNSTIVVNDSTNDRQTLRGIDVHFSGAQGGKIDYSGPGITIEASNSTSGSTSSTHTTLAALRVTGNSAGTGDGNAEVKAAGDFTVKLNNAEARWMYGIEAVTYDKGNAGVEYKSGIINVEADSTSTVQNGYGIIAWSIGGGSGSAFVKTHEGTEIHTKGDNIVGIHLGSANGTVADSNIILADINSVITTEGDDAHGISATVGKDALINITSAGSITTNGLNSQGIYAKSADGSINIDSNSNITTNGKDSRGIFAYITGGTGAATVINTGNIATHGENSAGIRVSNNSNKPNNPSDPNDLTNNLSSLISSSGKITTDDGVGLFIWNQVGNVKVQAINDITTQSSTAANVHAHGIQAGTSANGTAIVNFSHGTIKVTDANVGSSNGTGIVAWDNGSNSSSVNGDITLGPNAIIDATQAGGGVLLRVGGRGNVKIDQTAQVHGGSYGVHLAGATGVTGTKHTLENYGLIDSMNDQVIRGTLADGTALIDNYGTMTGYINFDGLNTQVAFNNRSANSLNLRHFADTDGDGIRDTKSVSISNFGGMNSLFKNEQNGMLRLSAVDSTLYDTTYLGYVTAGALDISNTGTVHGQLLNLGRFENRGTIDLSENRQAGDVLLISGATTAGTYGGGTFVADGGSVILDTVLNDGGANSLSDILVLDDVLTGAKGATRLFIKNILGTGALTTGDGIKVIEVTGSSASDSFELGNIVKGGKYEYTLHQGGIANTADHNWYLRAMSLNPDIGSYLANQTAATGLFMHSLHDRLGEPQLYENYRQEGNDLPAVWLRSVVSHTKNEAAGGAFGQHSEGSLIHLGGEVARWTGNGENRYHLGVMGAYGRTETKTTNRATGSRVNSNIDGYGVGAYFTWYDNDSAPEGWYSDVWSMYNWFDNETEGSDNYDSKVWTTSLEVGHASTLKALQNYDWMIEPQGQIAYHYYDVETIKDHNGLTITDPDANGFTTRLGLRTYLKPSTHRNGAQPFLEMNWLYGSAKNSMSFNGETISDDTPRHRFEAKVGVQGEITKNVQVYSHIGLQWGQNNYEHAEGQVGFRYRF